MSLMAFLRVIFTLERNRRTINKPGSMQLQEWIQKCAWHGAENTVDNNGSVGIARRYCQWRSAKRKRTGSSPLRFPREVLMELCWICGHTWGVTRPGATSYLCRYRRCPHWASWTRGYFSESWPSDQDWTSGHWAEPCQLCGIELSVYPTSAMYIKFPYTLQLDRPT